MKKALVLGAGGFIGSHMVKRLKQEGYWVRGVDLKSPDFCNSVSDEFIFADLRNTTSVNQVVFAPEQKSLNDRDNAFDEVYQFAADMGGAGYIFTGDNDANVMHNSIMINANVANAATAFGVKKIFYSSSACVYPQQIQQDPNNAGLRESDAYPVNPDSEYGYEKIFSERMYAAFHRNYGLNIRIARFHNIFGEEGTYKGGKEKAPAAMCRKVAEALHGEAVYVWGDGLQTRSFLYIDECIEGVRRLMESDYYEPINIGSDEMISINDLAEMVIKISGRHLDIMNVESDALGVRGRNSNNDLVKQVLGWSPTASLCDGMVKLYDWVKQQVNNE